jgi:hypothetical protein
VRALGLVQLQGAGERAEHTVGHAAGVAALEPGVVVDADPGQQRHLLAAQPGDAPVPAVGGQPRLIRGDPGPPRGQEVADLVPVVHDHEATFRPGEHKYHRYAKSITEAITSRKGRSTTIRLMPRANGS